MHASEQRKARFQSPKPAPACGEEHLILRHLPPSLSTRAFRRLAGTTVQPWTEIPCHRQRGCILLEKSCCFSRRKQRQHSSKTKSSKLASGCCSFAGNLTFTLQFALPERRVLLSYNSRLLLRFLQLEWTLKLLALAFFVLQTIAKLQSSLLACPSLAH